MRGKIIKGIAGFYLVDCGGEVLTCKARGLFRKRGEKPLVGDLAEVEAAQTSESEANIVTLLPRKNRLIRPAVSSSFSDGKVSACLLRHSLVSSPLKAFLSRDWRYCWMIAL